MTTREWVANILHGADHDPRTARDMAAISGLKLSTIRSTLTGMQYAGEVMVCGTLYRLSYVGDRPSVTRGRPANLYCLA